MEAGLEDRVALVTGGGSGIGQALAAELARRGARVAVTDIDRAAAQAVAAAITAAGGQAQGWQLDVADRAAWDRVAAEVAAALGPVDMLLSNAGSNSSRQFVLDTPVDYMRWLFEVNVFGAVHGAQALVPAMVARGRGQVLFTGSMAGLGAAPTVGDYSATKHALLALAESLRAELADTGVSVGYLCPAAVPSRLSETSRNLAPAALAARLPATTEAGEAQKRRSTAQMGGLVDAETVARIALDGLAAGRFLIPTHAIPGDRTLRRHREYEEAVASLVPAEAGP